MFECCSRPPEAISYCNLPIETRFRTFLRRSVLKGVGHQKWNQKRSPNRLKIDQTSILKLIRNCVPIFIGFWCQLGSMLGRFGVPNPSPRRPWACQNRKDRPRAPQDPSWRPTWRHFGSILAQLGAILAPSWPNLEHFGRFWRPKSVQEADARKTPEDSPRVDFWSSFGVLPLLHHAFFHNVLS